MQASLYPNLNISSPFAIDAKALSQWPCAQSHDPTLHAVKLTPPLTRMSSQLDVHGSVWQRLWYLLVRISSALEHVICLLIKIVMIFARFIFRVMDCFG